VNAADQAAAKAPKHQTRLGIIHKSPDKQTMLNANEQCGAEQSTHREAGGAEQARGERNELSFAPFLLQTVLHRQQGLSSRLYNSQNSAVALSSWNVAVREGGLTTNRGRSLALIWTELKQSRLRSNGRCIGCPYDAGHWTPNVSDPTRSANVLNSPSPTLCFVRGNERVASASVHG
jgi:hypothetical protein